MKRVILFILCLIPLLAVAAPVSLIYQKPLLESPTDAARLYIYDPVTKSDRNLTWGLLRGLLLPPAPVWSSITDKPSEFAPAAHNQGIDTVTGLQATLSNILNPVVISTTPYQVLQANRGRPHYLDTHATGEPITIILPASSAAQPGDTYLFITNNQGLGGILSYDGFDYYTGDQTGIFDGSFGSAGNQGESIQVSKLDQTGSMTGTNIWAVTAPSRLALQFGKLDWDRITKNGASMATDIGLHGVATTGNYNDLSNRPNVPDPQVNSDWYSNSGLSQILNRPNLAPVATSGLYSSLSGLPTIPLAQVNSDWAASSGIAQVLNKPEIPQVCVNVYDGRDGSKIFTGTSLFYLPQTSANGDIFINTVAGTYYQKIDAGWEAKGSLIGPTGNTGSTGATGADGKTILSGSGVPSSVGVNGDFYLDTDAAHLYGPKAGGVWQGMYTELVGPQGIQGPAGASSSITQSAVLEVLNDPTDGATVWVQQGATEQATAAKSGTKDKIGNAKQWIDSNGTVVRQCITSDSDPAVLMLSSTGAVIYSLSCDNTMTFSGTVIIK